MFGGNSKIVLNNINIYNIIKAIFRFYHLVYRLLKNLTINLNTFITL